MRSVHVVAGVVERSVECLHETGLLLSSTEAAARASQGRRCQPSNGLVAGDRASEPYRMTDGEALESLVDFADEEVAVAGQLEGRQLDVRRRGVSSLPPPKHRSGHLLEAVPVERDVGRDGSGGVVHKGAVAHLVVSPGAWFQALIVSGVRRTHVTRPLGLTDIHVHSLLIPL